MIDFMMYYLTDWYKSFNRKPDWSTTIERATYALGIVLTFWFISIWEIYLSIIGENFKEVPFIPTAVCAMFFMAILHYYYIHTKRYESISKKFQNRGNAKFKRFLVLLISIGSLALPYLIMLFVV